jgi:hypothetical protein
MGLGGGLASNGLGGGGGGSGAVSSVFTRTGAVVATSGDYSVSQVTGAAPLASPTFTGTVTVPTTVNATDAAQKAYVDGVAQGLSVKPSVQEATAAALPTNTYLAGVITVTATGTLTVDGILTALGDRVLVKNEATQAHNGIYTVTTAGAVSVQAVLTRAVDMNTGTQVPGAFAFVEQGTANAGAGFVVAGEGPYTIGTTAIVWTQFSGAGEVTAGTGLTKTGNTLAVDETVIAPLASPALSGTPTAPTAAALTNNTQVATTAYTDTAVGVETTRAEAAEALKAPLASPTLTGTAVLPTTTLLPLLGYGIPSTWKYETLPRQIVGSTLTLAALASGELSFFLIFLPSGAVISKIGFISGSTAASTPTHQWFALYDQNLNALAVTADDTATAWTAQLLKSKNIADTYSSGWNANTSFTTTYTGFYYVGIMVAASTVPTLVGGSVNGTLDALSPVTGFQDTAHTGLTTPTGAPAVATQSSTLGPFPYALLG